MKLCTCCDAALPGTAMRLICPPCAQSLAVGDNSSQIICKLHGYVVPMNALEADTVKG